jgi:hypothetical protein
MTYDIVCNIGIIRCRTSDVRHRTSARIQMAGPPTRKTLPHSRPSFKFRRGESARADQLGSFQVTSSGFCWAASESPPHPPAGSIRVIPGAAGNATPALTGAVIRVQGTGPDGG